MMIVLLLLLVVVVVNIQSPADKYAYNHAGSLILRLWAIHIWQIKYSSHNVHEP